jgi:hypothetical protein
MAAGGSPIGRRCRWVLRRLPRGVCMFIFRIKWPRIIKNQEDGEKRPTASSTTATPLGRRQNSSQQHSVPLRCRPPTQGQYLSESSAGSSDCTRWVRYLIGSYNLLSRRRICLSRILLMQTLRTHRVEKTSYVHIRRRKMHNEFFLVLKKEHEEVKGIWTAQIPQVRGWEIDHRRTVWFGVWLPLAERRRGKIQRAHRATSPSGLDHREDHAHRNCRRHDWRIPVAPLGQGEPAY